MLSVERVKELVNDPSLADAEVEQIRDEFYLLAEVIFEQWKREQESQPNRKELRGSIDSSF